MRCLSWKLIWTLMKLVMSPQSACCHQMLWVVNTAALYLGGLTYSCQPRDWLSWQVFHNLPHFLQANAKIRIVPKLDSTVSVYILLSSLFTNYPVVWCFIIWIMVILINNNKNSWSSYSVFMILSGSQPGNSRYFSFKLENERTGRRLSVQLN